MASDFDDAPIWYWAAADGRTPGSMSEQAGDRFVVACGQRALWSRVRSEIDPGERVSWHGFGPRDGNASLADCVYVLFRARETYGVNYNRAVLELAQLVAFAQFLREAPSDLCNWVSNPVSVTPLRREAYDERVETELGLRVAQTLHIASDWWK